ncbi:MAG TPA: 3-hydroxyacyl-ACP dehydratase FabZ [Burkholderiales bacterium]|nr:3-hydroxyacyl-ACP dehydratase FabZ [Burkholderiales bacterium]
MSAMDIQEIMECLPHRYPFLLVDRVLSYEPGSNIVAIKNVSANEPFFVGHFPHHPVMPGVLIIEALAQTAALLAMVTAGSKNDGKSIYYFAGIDKARFKKPVFPGDTLTLRVSVTRMSNAVGKFTASACVGDDTAAEAELMCVKRNIARAEVE